MKDYRPASEELKNRIELILAESINNVNPEHIDLYIVTTATKLLEVFYDEIQYRKFWNI